MTAPIIYADPGHTDLTKRREQLERECDAMRDEAEDLRDKASVIDNDIRFREAEIAGIDKQLRRAGLLFRPEDAERWGVEVARAVYGTGIRGVLHILGGDWLTNGSMAWRVQSVPDGVRPIAVVTGSDFGAQLMGPRHAIDLASPTATAERGDKTISDFATDVGPVRFNDLYWRAVQAKGDEVAIVRADALCLVAFVDGQPVAVAMPITIPGENP